MSPESNPPSSRISRRGLALSGLAGALIVVLVVVNGVWSRNASEARLKEETGQQAIPIVAVVTPTLGANRSSLDLPGRLEAYSRAPIYARVSGFLKAWYVDIGMPVKAGQLLAEIEAPDLDQQLLQAKAALASAQAAETLATVTAQRWQQLGGSNTVAKQTVDEKTGDLTVKQALTRAAQANVDMQAKYDARNPAAIKRLVQQGGAQLRPFAPEIMEACYKAAVDTYAEIAATNEAFKKVHDAYMGFRNEEYLWFQIGDYTYDNFMIRQRAKG